MKAEVTPFVTDLLVFEPHANVSLGADGMLSCADCGSPVAVLLLGKAVYLLVPDGDGGGRLRFAEHACSARPPDTGSWPP